MHIAPCISSPRPSSITALCASLAIAISPIAFATTTPNTAVTPNTLAVSAPQAQVDLFNGKDLSGWVDVNTSASTWTVAKDETGAPIIKCTGIPTGILRTEKAYENFVLEFDWKHLSYPGNAGLFVWSDPYCYKGVPFSRSIEVQIMLTPDNVDGEGRTMYTGQGDIFSIWGASMKPDRPHQVVGSAACRARARRRAPANGTTTRSLATTASSSLKSTAPKCRAAPK
jgi:hypothetical protein